jgi:hypothetical protein
VKLGNKPVLGFYRVAISQENTAGQRPIQSATRARVFEPSGADGERAIVNFDVHFSVEFVRPRLGSRAEGALLPVRSVGSNPRFIKRIPSPFSEREFDMNAAFNVRLIAKP